MKIIDWRPWLERRLDRMRGRGGDPVAGVDPWSRLVGRVTAARAAARPPVPAGPFVISVGNLSVGGSGKTPVTGRLAGDLAAAGLKVAVLTRGYGSGLRGPLQVRPDCRECGDEARMLAGQLSEAGVQVVQARNRTAGLAWLREHGGKPDYVVVEDGFQTAGLGRHLDILILDAWTADSRGRCIPVAGRVLPFGPWREPPSAAQRAGIWLLETDEDDLPAAPPGILLAGFGRRVFLATPAGAAVGPCAGPWATLAGIARPEPFEAAARRLMGSEPVLAIRCRDHEPYRKRMLARVTDRLRAANCRCLVTTTKDWVKLAGRLFAEVEVRILRQDVVWGKAAALPDLVRERVEGHAEDAR